MNCGQSWIWDVLLPNLLSGLIGATLGLLRQWTSSRWLDRTGERVAHPASPHRSDVDAVVADRSDPEVGR